MILRQGISSLASHRANRLGSNNKQFAPVTWKAQRELPGIRKTDGQPENECIHFLVCPAVFRCALCAQRASKAGCPEAVDCGFVSRSVSCFYGDRRRFSASLLTQKRSVLPAPINSAFSCERLIFSGTWPLPPAPADHTARRRPARYRPSAPAGTGARSWSGR